MPERRIEAPSGNIFPSAGRYVTEVNGYTVPVIFNVDLNVWQDMRSGKTVPLDDRTTITLELPPLPELPRQTKAIPKIVHSVWVGGRVPNHLLDNLVANRKKLPKDYQVLLHLDVAPDYFERLAPILQKQKIRAIDMRREQFFDQSDIPDFNTHYEQLKEIGILAANSDLVRFPILSQSGGIYLDLDDEILLPSNRLELFATDELLLGTPTLEMHGQKKSGLLNNTPIAATRGSRICHAIAIEISARLSTNIALLQEDCSAQARQARLFQLTGPIAMNDMLGEWMPEVVDLAKCGQGSAEAAVIDHTVYADYIACLNQRMAFYFPFSDGIKIGNEGSWCLPESRDDPGVSAIRA